MNFGKIRQSWIPIYTQPKQGSITMEAAASKAGLLEGMGEDKNLKAFSTETQPRWIFFFRGV